ncbi:acyl-CoA dehydrogenase family protein [Amycolatopsis jejuensis]|uniref:acyl-CoA dehydrogenase family protein n=1 Tax=Amycolatopsis jejuensis TaxID=330084 RepID=UPI00068D9DE2|nr:acyl-CoA dehydrogenase family protein [Amycolatopsis jejuensis]
MPSTVAYTAPESMGMLPPELADIKKLAREVVEKECIPLEAEFLGTDPRTVDQGSVLTLGDHRGRNGALPAATWERLRQVALDTGLFTVDLPVELGGLGLGALGSFVVAEELNRSLVQLPVAKVPGALYRCEGTQRERYLYPVVAGEKRFAFALTEPESGSDATRIRTRATRSGPGTWRIRGEKTFISGADEADFVMLVASVRENGDERGKPTLFLIDREVPGIDITPLRMWHTAAPHQFTMHVDVEVGDEQMLGGVGEGFRLAQHFLVIHDRLSRGALACGILSRCLELATDWVTQRSSFGAPLADRQAIQWALTDVLMILKSIRAVSYECAAKADQGEDVRTLAAMAKFMGGNWGHRAIDAIMQIFGGLGESEEFPVVHWYRNLRHARIGGGTDEVQRILMARALLSGSGGALWEA